MNPELRTEFEVSDLEVGHFLHTRSGVVKKEQQGAIAVRAASLCRQLGKQRAELVTIQEARLVDRCALGRNRVNPRGDRDHLGRRRTAAIAASMGPRSDERGNPPLRTIEFSKNFGTLCERPSATGTVHRQALPRVVGKSNICKLFQASSGPPVFVVTSPLASLSAFRTRRTGVLRPSAPAPATWFESQGRADNLPCSRTRDASRACPFSARRRAKIPSSPLASD